MDGRTILAQAVPPDAAPAAASVRLRITPSAGVLYIHRPAYSGTIGSRNPRINREPENTGGGLTGGGRVEAIAPRWWVGVDAQFQADVLGPGSSFIAAAHIGPHKGGFRLGIGPVLVVSKRHGSVCASPIAPR